MFEENVLANNKCQIERMKGKYFLKTVFSGSDLNKPKKDFPLLTIFVKVT